MLNKTITAVIPNYNYATYLRRRIQEVLNQTYHVTEIVILDDASTDNSQDLISEIVSELRQTHPNLKIKTDFNTKNSENVFSQWQRGIKLATSEYIWICELDDSASPEFLSTLMPAFNDKEVVLSYCDSRIINKNSHLIIKDTLRQAKDLFRRRHTLGDYVVDGETELNKNLAVFNSIPNVSAIVFKNLPALSKILDQAKTYHLSGDWYFYIELAKLGKIAYSRQRLNCHRIHQNSVTNNTNLKERYKEMELIHQHVEDTVNLSKKTKSRIAKLEANLKRRWRA